MSFQEEGSRGHGRVALEAPPPAETQARKGDININFLVRLLLGRPWVVLGQAHFVPGTSSGFLALSYTMEAQFVPGDRLGLSRGRRVAERVYILKVYVPFSLARDFAEG